MRALAKRLTPVLLLLICLAPWRGALAAPEDGLPGGAAQGTQPDAAITEGVEHWMGGVDWSELETLLQGLPAEVRALWSGSGLQALTGELARSGVAGDAELTETLLPVLGELLRGESARLAGVAATLIGLSLVSGMTGALLTEQREGISGAAAFVCRCFTLTVVLSAFAAGAALALDCIRSICRCMELSTPVLMTLLTAIGGTASVGVFQPAMTLLAGGVCGLMETVVLPLVTCGGLLTLFSSLSPRMRLGELGALCRQTVKWVVGAATALYSAATALRGLTAAAFDGIAVRTAKYAAGSMFPLVGGLVTGSFDTVLGCAALVKNAAGITSILLCVSIAAVPLVRLCTTALMLRLTAALVQPVAQKEQVAMCRAGAEMLSGLLAACAAVTAMFIVTVGLIVGVGNAGLVG